MKATRRLGWLVLALVAVCLPLAGAPASDRGIGGTGAPPNASASGPAISDRGIGGTGIVGVITGFGSVFVDGLEVAYTSSTPLTVDGVSEPDAAPRVGQLATIVATDDHGFSAVSIDLRHEVSGPVTYVNPNGTNPDGGTFVVAGQTVAIDSATEGQRTVHPGDWVAVSGLREPDGVIAASRIDQRTPGTVLVRGTAMPGQMPGQAPAAGDWRIGDLPVQPPNGASLAPGANVTFRGTMVNGGLSDTTVDPDVLSSDPAAFFGGRVRRMVIESYVSAAGGHVRFGRGWLAEPGRGVVVPAGAHRAIVQLERGAHGDFIATHLRGAAHLPGGAHMPGGNRPGGPYRGDRRGAGEPAHAAPHPYGPARFEEHPWRDRGLDRGRAGFGPRRFGCGGGGCRRGRSPR
jgi:Domain of unknown function (DUF5666)